MQKEEQAKRFLEVVSENYDDLKKKWAKYQSDKHREFDDDVFSETILSVYNLILKNGLKEQNDDAYLNYFFKSFNINTAREKQYARESSATCLR